MEATPRQRVVRSLPIANSSFYTFYTLSTKNITTLHFEDNRQRTTVGVSVDSKLTANPSAKRKRSTIAHYSKLITKNIHAIAKPANNQQPKANSRLVVC